MLLSESISSGKVLIRVQIGAICSWALLSVIVQRMELCALARQVDMVVNKENDVKLPPSLVGIDGPSASCMIIMRKRGARHEAQHSNVLPPG